MADKGGGLAGSGSGFDAEALVELLRISSRTPWSMAVTRVSLDLPMRSEPRGGPRLALDLRSRAVGQSRWSRTTCTALVLGGHLEMPARIRPRIPASNTSTRRRSLSLAGEGPALVSAAPGGVVVLGLPFSARSRAAVPRRAVDRELERSATASLPSFGSVVALAGLVVDDSKTRSVPVPVEAVDPALTFSFAPRVISIGSSEESPPSDPGPLGRSRSESRRHPRRVAGKLGRRAHWPASAAGPRASPADRTRHIGGSPSPRAPRTGRIPRRLSAEPLSSPSP